MKRPGILAAILSLVLFSCSRDMDRPSTRILEGNWRMVSIKDNVSGASHGKPGSIPGDVDLSFVSVSAGQGFINGVTPTNTLFADYALYSLGEGNKISIPSVAATKVIETSWGLDFLYNVTTAHTYGFEPDGKLRIETVKKTLFFERN